MYGHKDKNPGILPLTVETIFAYIYENLNSEFLIRVSYIEVYNEQINDLLSPSSNNNSDQLTEEICVNIE
jgi:centromeric protein E